MNSSPSERMHPLLDSRRKGAEEKQLEEEAAQNPERLSRPRKPDPRALSLKHLLDRDQLRWVLPMSADFRPNRRNAQPLQPDVLIQARSGQAVLPSAPSDGRAGPLENSDTRMFAWFSNEQRRLLQAKATIAHKICSLLEHNRKLDSRVNRYLQCQDHQRRCCLSNDQLSHERVYPLRSGFLATVLNQTGLALRFRNWILITVAL